MDLLILNNFFFYLPFSETSVFDWLHYTDSKFRIDVNNKLAILMIPQRQL